MTMRYFSTLTAEDALRIQQGATSTAKSPGGFTGPRRDPGNTATILGHQRIDPRRSVLNPISAIWSEPLRSYRTKVDEVLLDQVIGFRDNAVQLGAVGVWLAWERLLP